MRPGYTIKEKLQLFYNTEICIFLIAGYIFLLKQRDSIEQDGGYNN